MAATDAHYQAAIGTISRARLTAALALAAAGAIFYNLLPLTLGVAQDDLGLGDTAIGLLGASFFFGFNLVSASAYFWMHRVSARHLALMAIATGSVCLALSIDRALPLMLLLTAFAGGAFSVLYGMAAAIIGETPQATRWFGAKITLEAIVGTLLVLILPGTLIQSHGYPGLVAGIVIAVLLLSPLCLLVTGRIAGMSNDAGTGNLPNTEVPGNTNAAATLTALLAAGLFFAGQTTVWAFVERMGANAGFPPQALASLLSITLVCAVLGSLTAALLGDRLGNVPPFIAACALFFVGALAIANGQGFWPYAIGASIVTYSVGLGIAFAVSEVARLDSNGRYVIFSVPAVGIGAMFGPGIAGFLADAGGYGAVLAFGAVTVGLAAVLLPLASGMRTAGDRGADLA